MTIGNLLERKEFNLQTGSPDIAREINGGICCDLLSWVMAKGQTGMVWVTVQIHMNVIAVASLHEFAAILLAEGCVMPPDVLAKAEEEGIAVFTSNLSGYQICGLLHEAGIK